MKTFTFIFDPESGVKQSFSSLHSAIKTGVPHIEKDQMRSPSLRALLSIATENRLNMFKVIHNEKPDSLYELAQFLGKNLSYVSKEIRILESMNIIKLEKFEENGREKIKPVALYDRIVLDFDLAMEKAAN